MIRYEIFGYELTWNGSKFTSREQRKKWQQKHSILNWIFRGNYHVLSTFWVELHSEKEILTSKFLIDIFFFDTYLIDLIRKPKHNNRFPIHIVNRDMALPPPGSCLALHWWMVVMIYFQYGLTMICSFHEALLLLVVAFYKFKCYYG